MISNVAHDDWDKMGPHQQMKPKWSILPLMNPVTLSSSSPKSQVPITLMC